MKSNRIIAAVTAACLSVSGLALAQQDRDGRADQARRDEPRMQHQPPPRHDDRGPDRHHDRGPGAGPDHNYYRGGRLPPNFRGNEYVIDNWREHHLRQPPRGYHWVQTGADYVLVAVATGIIADILLNH